MEGIPLALDAERPPMLELLVIGNLECTSKIFPPSIAVSGIVALKKFISKNFYHYASR